jgi:hypothetical protein
MQHLAGMVCMIEDYDVNEFFVSRKKIIYDTQENIEIGISVHEGFLIINKDGAD